MGSGTSATSTTRSPWRDCPGVRPLVELGLCHSPSVLRHVVLLHEPGLGAVGLAEELEGDQGVQERCLSVAEGLGREGRQPSLAGLGGEFDEVDEGAGGLHWREVRGPLQALDLPLLRAQPLHEVARYGIVLWTDQDLVHGTLLLSFVARFDASAAAASCSARAWILQRCSFPVHPRGEEENIRPLPSDPVTP